MCIARHLGGLPSDLPTSVPSSLGSLHTPAASILLVKPLGIHPPPQQSQFDNNVFYMQHILYTVGFRSSNGLRVSVHCTVQYST